MGFFIFCAMELLSESVERTSAIGRKLGRVCQAGDIICLGGQLGAGKTALVQAIAEGAGVAKKEYVNSPTFAILHEYQGRIPIYHMDFYRLETSDDVRELGLDEYLFREGLVLIEWYERAADLMPASSLFIHLSFTSEFSRTLTMQSSDESWRQRLSRLSQNLSC